METLHSSSHCINQTTAEVGQIVTILGSIGAAGVVVCTMSTIVILCLRTYKVFTDRLVLYIMLTAILYSLVATLQLLTLARREMPAHTYDGVCKAIGYLHVYALLAQVSVHGLMSLHLLLFAVFHFEVSRHEKLVIGAILFLPLFVAAVPFITDSYGPSVAWCWIKSHRIGRHDHTAFVEQMALGYAPQVVVMAFSLCVAVTVLCIIRRHSNNEHQQAVRNTLHLVFYPLVIELLCLLGMTNRIYHYVISDPYCQVAMWYLAALFVPMKGTVIALTFLTHTSLSVWRRRQRRLERESETWYRVPREFTSDDEPLIIRSPQIQTPYEALFDR